MGKEDTITDYRIWRKVKANYSHEIRVLDVKISTLQKELIKVIHIPVLPKYLDNKKEYLIRYQRERELFKRIIKALNRNIEGVESTNWFKEQNMILRKSSSY